MRFSIRGFWNWRQAVVIASTMLSVTGVSCWAQTAPVRNGSTNAPRFEVTIRTERAAQVILGQHALIKTERSQFAFLIPEGLKMVVNRDQRRLVLVNTANAPVVTILIRETSEGETPVEPKASELKQSVLAEHPGSTILEEFNLSAGGTAGPAIEFEWTMTAGQRVPTNRRVVRVLLGTALVEFQRTSPADQKADPEWQFNSVLVTFRSAPADAKLDTPPLSDKM